MTTDNPVELLKALTASELKVLELKCQGLKYEVIGQSLGYGVDWVQLHMSNAYRKLRVPGDLHPTKRNKILQERFCPSLELLKQQGIKPPPDDPNPIADSRALVLVKQDDWIDDEEEETEEPPIVYLPGPRRRIPPIVWVLGVIALVVVITAWATASFTARNILNALPTAPPVSQDTQAPLVIVVTATSLPAQPTQVQLPASPDVPTEPPPPTEAPLLALPFTDNFDSGLRSEWIVISGNPVVVDGELGAVGGKVKLELGNSLPENVTIDFDFRRAHPYGTDPIYVFITRDVYYELNYYYAGWYLGDEANADVLSDAADSPREGHFRVEKDGSTYRSTIAGENPIAIVYGQPSDDPLGIVLAENTFIDNLNITSP